MLYTWERLQALSSSERDALIGIADGDTMIGGRDFGNIAIAAANDGMTMKEWLEVAIHIYLSDFEERHPGLLHQQGRCQ